MTKFEKPLEYWKVENLCYFISSERSYLYSHIVVQTTTDLFEKNTDIENIFQNYRVIICRDISLFMFPLFNDTIK